MNGDYMTLLAMISVLTFVAAIVYIICNATTRELEARAQSLDAVARIMNAANEKDSPWEFKKEVANESLRWVKGETENEEMYNDKERN